MVSGLALVPKPLSKDEAFHTLQNNVKRVRRYTSLRFV
jgi:hypothetical protein